MGGGVSILYTNAQSVVRKMEELRVWVAEQEPTVVAITETWTHDEIDDNWLKIKGYEMVAREDRKDTSAGRGGGVLVYVRSGVNAWKVEENAFNQVISIRVKIRKEIMLSVVYRSPNSTRANDVALCNWIRSTQNQTIIFGDLNFPGVDWESGTSDARGRPFLEACGDAFLIQHVEEATHINGNRLDLVLSKHGEMVREIEMKGRLGHSDHEAMTIHLYDEVLTVRPDQGYRDFNRGKYEEIQGFLAGIAWEEKLEGKNVEGTWEAVKQVWEECVERWIPWREKSQKGHPKWYTIEIGKMCGRKRKAWIKWKKSKKEEERRAYETIEKEVKKRY